MKTICSLLIVTFSMSYAFAGDSTWLLCQGEALIYKKTRNIVLNIHEGRSGFDARSASLTLIYGGHVMTGSMDTSDKTSANVNLGGENVFYQGAVQLDLSGKVSLKGNLALDAETLSPITAELKCENL